MSSILSIDAFSSLAAALSVLIAGLSFVLKVYFDSREAQRARERLIAAEKYAFQVTRDVDYSELEAQINAAESGARAAARHAHAELVSAAKLSDLYAKQIEKYQTDTQARASWSFFFAVFAMAGGLAFVVWGGTHLLTSPGWEHVAGATAIAGIGGATGAFIAKTFLDVHRLSLSQLNHYFRQPVVNAHVLTGQRLADQLADPVARQRGYELLLRRVADLIREDSMPGAVWGGSLATSPQEPKAQEKPAAEPPHQ
jgi:hypothetical protein